MQTNKTHYYLVNGLPQYYPNQIDIKSFPLDCEVEYLGTRERPLNSISLYEWSKPKPIKAKNKIVSTSNKTGVCCYCEIDLHNGNYTKEHIIPKSKGGNIMMPCCYDCNQERGNYPLEIYALVLKTLNPIYYRKKVENINRIRIALQKIFK